MSVLYQRMLNHLLNHSGVGFCGKTMMVWVNYRLSNYIILTGKTWCIFPFNPVQKTQLRSQNRKTNVIPHLLDAYKNCDCTARKILSLQRRRSDRSRTATVTQTSLTPSISACCLCLFPGLIPPPPPPKYLQR